MTKQDRQQELQKQREVDQISDFVNDHYAQFGAYPMEVQTETSFYTFDQYWSILDKGRSEQIPIHARLSQA